MSFGIIISGKNRPSESKRFRPHANIATGKYHHTKEDYLATVKKMNLVPYEKPVEQKDPVYKRSKWAEDMVKAAKRGGATGAWREQIEKRGINLKQMQANQDKARKMGATDAPNSGFSDKKI